MEEIIELSINEMVDPNELQSLLESELDEEVEQLTSQDALQELPEEPLFEPEPDDSPVTLTDLPSLALETKHPDHAATLVDMSAVSLNQMNDSGIFSSFFQEAKLPSSKAQQGTRPTAPPEQETKPEVTAPTIESVTVPPPDVPTETFMAMTLPEMPAPGFSSKPLTPVPRNKRRKPTPLPKPPEEPMQARIKRIDTAQRNEALLARYITQKRTGPLFLDATGTLSTKARPTTRKIDAQSAIYVCIRNGKPHTFSVGIGFGSDEQNDVCERHLVLKRDAQNKASWHVALRAEAEELAFKQWTTPTPKQQAHLNDTQQAQLHYLLTPDDSEIGTDPLHPRTFEEGRKPSQTLAFGAEAANTPSTILSGPAIPLHPRDQELLPLPELPVENTAMRRVSVRPASLNPEQLILHIKLPGLFHGNGFAEEEHQLTITDPPTSYKVESLGVSLQFGFSKTQQGKVFPQITAKRSINVRGVRFADHDMMLLANKNPKAKDGYDQVQELLRGHAASVDLSPTDQIRGILLLTVRPPESKGTIGQIHCSWSLSDADS
jgi:hypothetical protein